jgi:hypothetical protein
MQEKNHSHDRIILLRGDVPANKASLILMKCLYQAKQVYVFLKGFFLECRATVTTK